LSKLEFRESFVEKVEVIIMLLSALLLAMAILIVVFSFLFYVANPEESKERQRLKQLQKRTNSNIKTFDFDEFLDLMVKKVEPLSRSFYEKNQSHQKEIKILLTRAGLVDSDSGLWRFLGIQVLVGLLCGGIFAFGTFVVTVSSYSPSETLYYCGFGLVIGGIIGRMLPEFYLKNMASKRQDEIQFTLADVVDLLIVCIDAGLGMDAALLRVGEETARMAPEMSQELKRLIVEVNAGIPRAQAFQNMAQRSGVEDLRYLCNMLIQADRMGASVTSTLRVYSEDSRVRRRQLAEELANKASTKMTFPLVLFIFPPMFVILIGPTLITALDTFFK